MALTIKAPKIKLKTYKIYPASVKTLMSPKPILKIVTKANHIQFYRYLKWFLSIFTYLYIILNDNAKNIVPRMNIMPRILKELTLK